MSTYTDYTINITLRSPVITPFQSDTIFGHICWAIRFLGWKEKDKLGEFLNAFDQEQQPPLLVSNGFPKGMLPKPVIPPVTQQELETVVGRQERITNSFKIKFIKKINLIPKENFVELQKISLSPLGLFKRLYAKFDELNLLEKGNPTVVVQHNTVNRMECKVKEGLYTQRTTFCDPDFNKFTIYLKTLYFNKTDLERIFRFIQENGFGKDKSTGKGYFTFTIDDGIDLPEAENPNAFLTLSSYVPTAGDPVDGYYNIVHKYGKLGGSFASGSSEVSGNPFKKPLIMFSAGSTFFDQYTSGKYYGSLLKNVHPNSQIRHYGYAFPVGINLHLSKELTHEAAM